jgi:hypothetical protein
LVGAPFACCLGTHFTNEEGLEELLNEAKDNELTMVILPDEDMIKISTNV